MTIVLVVRRGLLATVFVVAACESPASSEGRVGDECRPHFAPEGGFHASEVAVEVGVKHARDFPRDPEIVESTHPDCRTGFCIVNHYEGDLVDENEDEIARRVYCTCRCGVSAGGDDASITCEACPSGFECCPTFAVGGEGLKGDYCVREGTCEQ